MVLLKITYFKARSLEEEEKTTVPKTGSYQLPHFKVSGRLLRSFGLYKLRHQACLHTGFRGLSKRC